MNDITNITINLYDRATYFPVRDKSGRTAMIPFQVDPSWYERYWWREQIRRRSTLPARLIEAAESIGRFLLVALQFVGTVLVLIVSGDFHLPRCDDAREPVQPTAEHEEAVQRRRRHNAGISSADASSSAAAAKPSATASAMRQALFFVH
jgi:hypothetical protein